MASFLHSASATNLRKLLHAKQSVPCRVEVVKNTYSDDSIRVSIDYRLREEYANETHRIRIVPQSDSGGMGGSGDQAMGLDEVNAWLIISDLNSWKRDF